MISPSTHRSAARSARASPATANWRVRASGRRGAKLEQAMSPQRHLDLLRAPIAVSYGTNETPEFQRQSRGFAVAVKAAGKPVELIVAENYNHFEIEESLGNPYGPNGRAALLMMRLRSA
jgi:hypothetical protein